MKFKLIESYKTTREIVQEYMYDAMDELNNVSLEEYIQWFKDNLTAYPEDIEQAVTDAYIEACDYGMIKGVEKTRLTSELKEYIEAHTDIIDDTAELMRQCPGHLQHELKIVLSKLDESLNESVLEEALRPDLKRFIEQHAELLDENNIEELYKQCPRELKLPLIMILKAASLGNDSDIIKRAMYLEDNYEDEELIDLALSVTHHANDVFDAFDFIMNNWNEFFDDNMLNEELLTEKMWIKVVDNTGLSDPFYFYATDKNVLKDVNTLLPIIKNKQKGTYKQQLNQKIVKELQSNYNSSSKKYVLKIVSTKVPTSELAAMKDRIITIADRDLRREAEQAAVSSTGLNPKEWLVHHKVKGEEDNTLTNIALISRNSASRLDDAVAHAVHKILENQGNPGGAITSATFSVDIQENIAGTWAKTHAVDITIR